MSFFGLFGHDKNPAANNGITVNLPKAPPSAWDEGGVNVPYVASPAAAAPQLPAAPPVPGRPSLWDAQHRKDTLLAISAGILQGNNFAEGLGGAAQNLLAQRQRLQAEGRPQLGGPDSAFEVYTDPVTGQHTFKPIQEVVDYQNHKRVKQKDVADIHGRVMYAIGQLDPKDQAAAYADVKANPDYYGVDPDVLPPTWNPAYGRVIGNMGMTVSQAMTRDQAGTNEDHREVHRTAADADRTARTNAYLARSQAATAQGAERIGIARDALGFRKAGGGKAAKPSYSTMSNADLLAILGH